VTEDDRWERGAAEFTAVTGMPAPSRGADYVADVVIDQVFAEIWTRPGLTRKERRWIAITCASMSSAPFAMETHIGAALGTGDITIEEMREFVIQFAVYAGHPKATAVRLALDAAWSKVQHEQRQETLPTD
jgi:4-carboxymuconolactone decarboxylase